LRRQAAHRRPADRAGREHGTHSSERHDTLGFAEGRQQRLEARGEDRHEQPQRCAGRGGRDGIEQQCPTIQLSERADQAFVLLARQRRAAHSPLLIRHRDFRDPLAQASLEAPFQQWWRERVAEPGVDCPILGQSGSAARAGLEMPVQLV
jgi:hypothetical protein